MAGVLTQRHVGGSDFPFPRALGSLLNGRGCRARAFQEERVRAGFQYRSPGFPIRLLFSEPVSLYTHTRVCTHTCIEQHSAGSESRSGASSWTFLPDSPPEGHGKGGERAG